jgi:hypothetical protein
VATAPSVRRSPSSSYRGAWRAGAGTAGYVLDQDEALDFYVSKLGLEINTDADLGFMRWLLSGRSG